MTAPANGVPNDANSAAYASAVVKSDTTALLATRGLWVGGAGDVAVKMAGDGATVTFLGVPAGTLLPIKVTAVMSTNTTATNILALA